MRFEATLSRAARMRWVLPVLLGSAFVAVAINEVSYRYGHGILNRGIALTDARIRSAATLQALTDAELLVRTILLYGDAADVRAFDTAVRKVGALQDDALNLVSIVDESGELPVSKVRELIKARTEALTQWVQLAAAGRQDEARELAHSDQARKRLIEVRSAFDTVLEGGARIQRVARVSLYDAMQLTRLALHLLVAVAALALYFVVRQFRAADSYKEEQQRRLEEQIVLRTGELRELAGHLVSAREDERSRVARELHDELGGMLTAMKLEFARLRRLPGLPAEAAPRLASIDARLTEGIALKRRIIENLRPSALDQLGLKTSLEILCADVSSVLGKPVHAAIDDVEMDKDVALTVYRVVQESLTNACKYADPSALWVTLTNSGSVARLSVRDDGNGFDPSSVEHGRHGLLGMRVRIESHGGTFRVFSKPGAGSEISGELPLTKPAAARAPELALSDEQT